MPLTWLDPLLLCLFILGAWDGWRRGCIVHGADLCTLLPVLWLMVRTSTPLADTLVMRFGMVPLHARLAAPVFIFVIMEGGCAVVLSLLYRTVPEATRDARLNRSLGIPASLIKVLAYVALVTAVLAAAPREEMRDLVHGSLLGRPTAALGNSLLATFGISLSDQMEQACKTLRVSNENARHGSHALQRIPPITQEMRKRIAPELENELIQRVNEERKQAGLQPLEPDSALRDIARAHSEDMFRQGYFAHRGLDGRDALERAQDAGIRFQLTGENIALAPSLELAHEGLMNSPDHRANLLDPRYSRVGIGIVLGASAGLMVTQSFSD